MGLVDPTHLLLIGVIALIVIGPRRLPELMHAVRRAAHEFRSALDDGGDGGDKTHAPER